MSLRLDLRIEQLVPILRCPVSGNSLTLLGSTELENLVNGMAEDRRQGVTGGLVAENSGWTYLIRGPIFDLRPEKAIATTAAIHPTEIQAGVSQTVKNSVKDWYDSFGWKRNDQGILNDTAVFSQNDSTIHGAYEMSSHFALADRFQGGQFLLDAASGAIAHPEYLAYSYHHRFRVCVDFSESALLEASSRIGERGFCVLADICQMPFVDDAFEGVISGYTVQHIHQDQQQRAVEELYRVLRPGNHLCVMTGISVGTMHHLSLKVAKFAASVLNLMGFRDRLLEPQGPVRANAPPHQLYCHYWTFEWWRRLADRLSPLSTLHCLRLFSKSEFNGIVHSRHGVRVLRGFESMYSQLLARASYFIVVDVAKPERRD